MRVVDSTLLGWPCLLPRPCIETYIVAKSYYVRAALPPTSESDLGPRYLSNTQSYKITVRRKIGRARTRITVYGYPLGSWPSKMVELGADWTGAETWCVHHSPDTAMVT